MYNDQCNITFLEYMVFLPKDAVCTTEVDIANLKHKHCIDWFYRYTMESAKDQQLEAKAVDAAAVNIEEELKRVGSGVKHFDKKPKSHGAVEQLALSFVTCKDKGDKLLTPEFSNEEKGHRTDRCEDVETRTPPKKPPRQIKKDAKSSSKDKGVEVVAISFSRPLRQEENQFRNHDDTSPSRNSVSRLSTFSPRSPTQNTKGHTRSRSETLQASQLPICADSVCSPSDDKKNFTSTSKKVVKGLPSKSNKRRDLSLSPTPPSNHVSHERSLQKSRDRSRMPSKEHSISPSSKRSESFLKSNSERTVTIPYKPSSPRNKLRYAEPTVSKSPLDNTYPRKKQGNHRKEKKEVDNSVLISETKNSTVSSDGIEKPCLDGKSVESSKELASDGRKSPLPIGTYNRMLRELSFHTIMKKKSSQDNKESDPILSSSIFYSIDDSNSSHLLDVNTSSDQERQRNPSSPSNFQVPSFQFTPPGEIPVPDDSLKPKYEVRKSTFFAHEEEDPLLEDKPLSFKMCLRKYSLPDDHEAQPLSPASPRSVVSCDTYSDQDESACSGGKKGSLWLATSTEEGKIYFYEESGSKSQWKLPEFTPKKMNIGASTVHKPKTRNIVRKHGRDQYIPGKKEGHEDIDDLSDGKEACNRPLSPENRRISLLGENLSELSPNTEKEGFLHRTFIMREGKKCRKNWTNSYVRYIRVPFKSGASGVLYFSKTKDDDKKAEWFEFYDICHLERTNDKKTSRQQVLGLRNGRDTEVLLQFDDKDIADEWFKVLQQHEGMTVDDTPAPEEKKGKKTGDKVKRESSADVLNDNKGITDKLRSFIKRRPQREILEKKGIYKESVFGSTLAELASQDKTGTPIFVLQCINNIEKSDENLRTDGLYRISGNAAQIQKIRYEIAQRNYTVLSKEKDVHNLSGALKLFFRELKEPLIPFANYDDFIQATDFELRRMNQQVEKLTKAVSRLPSENYETLKVLLMHLIRVTEYESDNRMSMSNLAIVFGPCLLWPKVTTSNDLMTDVMLHNRVIEGLLNDFPRIFRTKR